MDSALLSLPSSLLPLLQLGLGSAIGALAGLLLHSLIMTRLLRGRGPGSYLYGLTERMATQITLLLRQSLADAGDKQSSRYTDMVRTAAAEALHGWVDRFMEERLASIHPMAGALIKGALGKTLREMLKRELDTLLPSILQNAVRTGIRSKELEATIRQLLLQGLNTPDSVPFHSLLHAETRIFRTCGLLTGGLAGFSASALSLAVQAL